MKKFCNLMFGILLVIFCSSATHLIVKSAIAKPTAPAVTKPRCGGAQNIVINGTVPTDGTACPGMSTNPTITVQPIVTAFGGVAYPGSLVTNCDGTQTTYITMPEDTSPGTPVPSTVIQDGNDGTTTVSYWTIKYDNLGFYACPSTVTSPATTAPSATNFRGTNCSSTSFNSPPTSINPCPGLFPSPATNVINPAIVTVSGNSYPGTITTNCDGTTSIDFSASDLALGACEPLTIYVSYWDNSGTWPVYMTLTMTLTSTDGGLTGTSCRVAWSSYSPVI